MLRIPLLLIPGLLAASIAGFTEQRMVSIGDRRMAVYCDGEAAHSPTVVLIPAGGRTAKDWATVQPAVSTFTRVCSYDHANFGESDKAPVKLQSVDEVVDDLRAWLRASGEKGPFVLVGHSNSGIYARRFVTRYPREAAGLVFVDSAHEEQALRLRELDPEGPGLNDLTARIGFYVKPGQRLEWRTELPLIVLGRGISVSTQGAGRKRLANQPNVRGAVRGVGSHLERVSDGPGKALHARRVSARGKERPLHPARPTGARDSSDPRREPASVIRDYHRFRTEGTAVDSPRS